MLKRREFLKNLIQFSFGGFLLSKSISVKALEADRSVWEQIMEIARWCPSVHNLQPHKLKIIDEHKALLYYDPKRLLPYGDMKSIFATVAMGILIENMNIVAKEYGKKIELNHALNDIDNSAKGLTLFTTLSLVNTSDTDELKTSHIYQRRTSRSHYDGIPLPKEVFTKIQKETTEHGFEFDSSNDEKIVQLLIGLNQQTLFEDLESDTMRTELNALFRFSKEEAIARKDGLWSRCMGFPGVLMKSVFYNYQTWDHGLLKKMISRLYHTSFKGTTSIGWIVGDFNQTHDYLKFGRLMARNWLLFTKYNAYIQPFGSLLTNEKAYEKISQELNIPDNQKICMIFRVGYSKTPTRSYRLPLHEIIIH